jgi:predicted NAD/FAD-dependent oxidoreductase
MSSSNTRSDVVIVGAGLSGLLAAEVLQARGFQVRLLEKARGVGGRMATRRVDSDAADMGAQFFTAHDPRFQTRVAAWEKAGVVRRWSTGFAGPDGVLRDNGVARYCGVQGMAGVAKHLAWGLDVVLQAKAVRAEVVEDAWSVVLEDGSAHAARALLLTAPVPQSLALLHAGGVTLPEPLGADLAAIDYAPCLTVLARLSGRSRVPAPGGIWLEGEPLHWVADNSAKGVGGPGGGPAHSVVTIHAGQDFSREHWDTPEAEVTAALLAAAEPWLGNPVQATHYHRWKYSVPLRVHPAPCVSLAQPAPLAFAGDAFGGPRVEAAALSGVAAGEALAEALKAVAVKA